MQENLLRIVPYFAALIFRLIFKSITIIYKILKFLTTVQQIEMNSSYRDDYVLHNK